MKHVVVAITLILSALALGTTAKDVKEKAGETVDTATEYTKEQKEAFVKEMEENISSLKTKIKELKAKAGQSKDSTVEKLEKEQSDLEKDLAAMKSSSGRAWTKLKAGMSKAWSEIKTSMGEASKELKK